MPTMLLYPQFYKRFGIRQPAQIMAPRIFTLPTIGLPRGSILHYVADNKSEYGPASDDIILQNALRLVFIDHVVELTERTGNPRSSMVQPGPMILSYRTKYRKLRTLAKLDLADREQQNVIIENYALLPHLYKYARSFLMQYYTWSNIHATVIDKVKTRISDTKRQQYMLLNLEGALPTLQQFRIAEKRQTRQTLTAFTSNGNLLMLDLWIWLGNNRINSMLNRIPVKDLDRVDVVVRYGSYWLTVNLGVLNGWRNDGETGSKGLPPGTLQLRFLKMINILVEANTTLDDGKSKAVIDKPESDEEVTDNSHDQQLNELAEFDDDEVAEFAETDDTVLDDIVSPTDEDTKVYDEDGIIIDSGETPSLPSAVEDTHQAVRTLDGAIKAKANALADRGLLSAAEYRRLNTLSEGYKQLKDPFGSGQRLEEFINITPEDLSLVQDLNIPDLPEVFDKSMLSSTVSNIDKMYVDKVMNKDIVSMVLGIQHAGIAVTGYEVERITNAVSDYEIHKVTVQPAVGRQSTLMFRLPKIQDDGTFISNGSSYRLRKQRSELPIVKVSPIKVALTSYYSKLFVEKSERAVFNYDRWIINTIIAAALDSNNPNIDSIRISKASDNTIRLPRIYSALAERCAGFIIHRNDWLNDLPKTVNWKALTKESEIRKMAIVINVDIRNRFVSGLFDEEVVTKLEADGHFVVAGRAGKAYILVDFNDVFYIYLDGEVQVLGRLEDMIGLPIEKAPTPMAELKIFSKTIPVGIVLAYLLGFENLLKLMKINPRRVSNGSRLQLAPDEYAVRFMDESLIFQKDDLRSSLIFSGFNLYHAAIRNYSIYAFDKKDVYFNVLSQFGIGLSVLRELDAMDAMWVDPITQSLLVQMKEPVQYTALLLRAVEMLLTRHVPSKLDADVGFDGLERVRGYERFAGVVYSSLSKAIRSYNNRTAISTAQVSMSPHEVWVQITQDPACEMVNDINPIHNIKEQEVITFGGRGGRSDRSMVAKDRLFKESDLGFISEATVDSSQVAIITYVAPNANLTSVRGTVRSFDKERDGSSSIFSTAALLAPAADRDDPKRVNFINIQQTHGISSKGNRPTPLRTGYEQVLAHRTSKQFASAAAQNGKVVDVSAKHIRIEYADGSMVAFPLGRHFGNSAGNTLPTTISTSFKIGDTIERGDIVCYNQGFFEPNEFNKRQVVWKAGVIAKTAIMEASFTLEDSSAITSRLARQLATEITKVKTVVVKFDQSIRNLVQPGEKVDLDTILCTIEDSVTANNDLFDDESLSSLRLLSGNAPVAKTVGVIEKIEVFYNGDIEDMSESLQELAGSSDTERKRSSRRLLKPTITGSVDQSLRIDGAGLDIDSVAIRVYITSNIGTGIGDKAVFANQMKTVIGHTLEGVHETESGIRFDAIFGNKSIQARIVLSPMIIGTTNSLLRVIGEKAAKLYFGRK
jgi:hypothetical protein